MKRVEVSVTRELSHERSAVWERYTDHASWTEWAGLGTVRLAKPGAEERNGVGAVRAIENLGLLRVEEEVTAFEPPERMRYRLRPGPLPMSDHEGEVWLEATPAGTRLRWRCTFRTRPSLAPVLRAVVRATFTRALWGLGRDLDRAAR